MDPLNVSARILYMNFPEGLKFRFSWFIEYLHLSLSFEVRICPHMISSLRILAQFLFIVSPFTFFALYIAIQRAILSYFHISPTKYANIWKNFRYIDRILNRSIEQLLLTEKLCLTHFLHKHYTMKFRPFKILHTTPSKHISTIFRPLFTTTPAVSNFVFVKLIWHASRAAYVPKFKGKNEVCSYVGVWGRFKDMLY